MTPRKLARIRKGVAACRERQVKAVELVAIAERLGRVRENRGKEPVYAYPKNYERPPLAIPQHGGKDLPIGTKRSILNVLEEDVEYWESRLDDKK